MKSSADEKTRMEIDGHSANAFSGILKHSENIGSRRKPAVTAATKTAVGSERRSNVVAKKTSRAGANATTVAMATAKTIGENGKSSKITVRYNKAATLAKVAVTAKTTAQASLADFDVRTLPKPRKAPQKTGVTIRYNNASRLAQVAVTAKTTARESLAELGVQSLPKARKAPQVTEVFVRYNNAAKLAQEAVASKTVARTAIVERGNDRSQKLVGDRAVNTKVPPRRPADEIPHHLNRPSVNGFPRHPPRNRVLPAEVEDAGPPLAFSDSW
jgi:hypothetical protein